MHGHTNVKIQKLRVNIIFSKYLVTVTLSEVIQYVVNKTLSCAVRLSNYLLKLLSYLFT